jgi:hypothetical protein
MLIHHFSGDMGLSTYSYTTCDLLVTPGMWPKYFNLITFKIRGLRSTSLISGCLAAIYPTYSAEVSQLPKLNPYRQLKGLTLSSRRHRFSHLT